MIEEKRRHFGLKELGLLDGPPLRGANTVVQTAYETFGTSQAVFLAFDDDAACARVRISCGPTPLREVPLADSISAEIRGEDKSLAITDVSDEMPDAPELPMLSAQAFLGTPVHGPDEEPVGVLAVLHNTPRAWTNKESRRLSDLAHLISQEIMLRASFETLRIMSTDNFAVRS